MGGFQPFLRAVVSIGVAAKLMLVDEIDEPKRQTMGSVSAGAETVRNGPIISDS